MRHLGAFALGASMLAAPYESAYAAWPDDRPIEVVVGFQAGGGTDVMARKLSVLIEKKLGGKAKLIVVNRPGAAAEIANASIARAAPDGYTLGVINVPGFLFLPMTKKSQYSPSDFRLVARVVDDPTVMVVRSGGKYPDLKSVMDALRDKPGSVSFGHNGLGTNGQLAIALINEAAKVKVNEVPYRGSAAQKTDLLGGHLDVALMSVGEVVELHGGATGELKVIAQLSKSRLPVLPDIPTAEEMGLSVVMTSERGFALPKAVPDDIAKRIESALAESVRDPDFLATSPGDAPVLSYLPGTEWQAHLDTLAKLLRELADKMPK